MKNSGFGVRINIIIIITLVLAAACVVRLFDLQIVKGSEYKTRADMRLVRAYSVTAPRGEILDCKDKPLVENRMGYTIQVRKTDASDDELNKTLYTAAKLAASYGSEIESTFPIVRDKKTKELSFDFNIEKNGGTRKVDGVSPAANAKKKKETSTETDSEEEKRPDEDKSKEEQEAQDALADWKKNNKLESLDSPSQILEYYKKKYSVSSEFNDDEALTIAAIRYAMEKGRFSEKNPYTLARDVDELVIQQIKEQFMTFSGVEVVIEPVRSFANGTMAAHILGRTGKIYAEEYAEMKDQGYGMNDTIGKDGLEKVLEPYLKGEDGYKSVEMNRGGGVTQILESRDPKPGNFARLTIDSDLQAVMEKSLSQNIAASVGAGGAGAAIAVDPKTCGVLAMASYPTYDLTTFNEDYDRLIKAKSKPLINRALSGTYSPGSTFKPLVSIAALESGLITPETYITDRGKYTYFDSYQPTCLIYSSTGSTHGTINVSEAIGVSCNYFFYDVGRRMGIETIDDYAERFGLGKNTGIELPESTGILASPQYREQAGGTWYPGDVLQMAIGQSDNMFTPAQLASYLCTLLNKGTRYALHLVNEVVDYDTKEVMYHKEPEVLSENPISDSTYNAVKDGMRRVVASGTASAAFASSTYKAAGKTGTAEVPGGGDNVLFVGFAPYENPEIVIAVIIEHGASSSYPARVARDVFDAYMKIKDGKPVGDDKDGDRLSDENNRYDNIKPLRPAGSEKSSSNSSGSSSSSQRSGSSGSSNSSQSNESKSQNGSDRGGKRPEMSVPTGASSSEGEGTL